MFKTYRLLLLLQFYSIYNFIFYILFFIVINIFLFLYLFNLLIIHLFIFTLLPQLLKSQSISTIYLNFASIYYICFNLCPL